jgi:polyhydroxyalkanoate synthesis repressor PhaR
MFFALQQERFSMPASKIIIRKYENRRLYDTSQSRYINLDELADLIRRGADIQVVDAKTGQDLTRATLTQIIMEDAKEQPAGLPLELLRQLIVASDRARQDFLMWYLRSAFDSYQKVQETIQNQLSGVREATLAPLETVRRFFSAPAQTTAAVDAGEVEQLRRRVAELEAQVGKRPAVSRKARKSSPKKERKP